MKNESIRNLLNREFSGTKPGAPTVDDLLEAYYKDKNPDQRHVKAKEGDGKFNKDIQLPGMYALIKKDEEKVLIDHIKYQPDEKLASRPDSKKSFKLSKSSKKDQSVSEGLNTSVKSIKSVSKISQRSSKVLSKKSPKQLSRKSSKALSRNNDSFTSDINLKNNSKSVLNEENNPKKEPGFLPPIKKEKIPKQKTPPPPKRPKSKSQSIQ